MRITIYTDDPGEGGVAVYNHRMSLGLLRLGHDVTLVQSKPTLLGVDDLLASGVKLSRFLLILAQTRAYDDKHAITTNTGLGAPSRKRAPGICSFYCAISHRIIHPWAAVLSWTTPLGKLGNLVRLRFRSHRCQSVENFTYRIHRLATVATQLTKRRCPISQSLLRC